MLTTRYKSVFERFFSPFARAFAACGIHPNTITLTVPVLVLGLCLWFLKTRAVVPFCFGILVIGSLDGLDGALARVSGKTSRLGAYLDAMADRYVEVMVAATVAEVTGYWMLTVLFVAGSLLVSYAKARAAMEVSVSNQEWPDLAERTERDVLFVAGLALGSVAPWKPLGKDLFWWTLAGLVLLTHLTVLQRILRAKRYILERSA